MKLKIHFLILTLFLTFTLKAQEKYTISWAYKDLSFQEFVTKSESLLPVKFYFKDDWVTDLKLSDYAGCKTLSCILDNLFKGSLLYYYIDDSGNVVITKNFMVKILNAPVKNDWGALLKSLRKVILFEIICFLDLKIF